MSVRIFGSEPAGHACGPPRGEAPARMWFAILGGHRLRAFCGAGLRPACWVVIVRGRVPARMGFAISGGRQAAFGTLPAGNETAG